MEFLSAEAIKAYIEIGILGLCGVLTVTMAYLYFKREGKRQEGFDKRTDKIIDKQDERIDKKDNNNQTNFNELLKVIIDQNRQNQELLQKQFVELQNNVVKGVTTHTLSPEENALLSDIDFNIKDCLKRTQLKTDATRVALVRFHNGGRDMNGLSFLKMSMTSEVPKPGVTAIQPEFQSVFRSFFSYWCQELMKNGYCYIDHTEDLKDIDSTMYEYFKSRDIESVYGIAITKNNTVYGYIYMEFTTFKDVDKAQVEHCLHDKKIKIETLLDLAPTTQH